jgi:hypothetical protein
MIRIGVVVFLILLCCSSCTKTFDCECTTSTAANGVVDAETFQVQSKDRKTAHQDCLNRYQTRPRYASGEMECEVN